MSEASDRTFDGPWDRCSCGTNDKHAEDTYCADCLAQKHAMEKED